MSYRVKVEIEVDVDGSIHLMELSDVYGRPVMPRREVAFISELTRSARSSRHRGFITKSIDNAGRIDIRPATDFLACLRWLAYGEDRP